MEEKHIRKHTCRSIKSWYIFYFILLFYHLQHSTVTVQSRQCCSLHPAWQKVIFKQNQQHLVSQFSSCYCYTTEVTLGQKIPITSEHSVVTCYFWLCSVFLKSHNSSQLMCFSGDKVSSRWQVILDSPHIGKTRFWLSHSRICPYSLVLHLFKEIISWILSFPSQAMRAPAVALYFVQIRPGTNWPKCSLWAWRK